MRSKWVSQFVFSELYLKTYKLQASEFMWFGCLTTLCGVRGAERCMVYKQTYSCTVSAVNDWSTLGLGFEGVGGIVSVSRTRASTVCEVWHNQERVKCEGTPLT